MISKRAWMHQHAKRRAKERFGLDLNKRDLLCIRDLIQSGQAQFVERQTLDRTLWAVTWQDKILHVVYSKRHKSIVTVLYPKEKREDERFSNLQI